MAKVNKEALTSYKETASEQCWYDDCDCKEILPADCEELFKENNRGVGRYACLSEKQDCYSPKFFTKFLKKLTCQLNHYIENICALWGMVNCIADYVKNLGDMGTTSTIYLRNSDVSSFGFYHNITDEYDLSIYMDSTTGVVAGESDDGRRKMTDRRYRAYIRWCADGTSLNPAEDNTMQFTVYTSGETFSEKMMLNRSVHWQMRGIQDGAMEMSDSIIIEKGQYLKLRVTPANNASGTFRVHQFKVEYTPVLDSAQLPECLK